MVRRRKEGLTRAREARGDRGSREREREGENQARGKKKRSVLAKRAYGSRASGRFAPISFHFGPSKGPSGLRTALDAESERSALFVLPHVSKGSE